MHLVLLLVVFGSTVQRMEQNLIKQGMCTYCHFAPWNSKVFWIKKISVTAQLPSVNRERSVNLFGFQQQQQKSKKMQQKNRISVRLSHHSSHIGIDSLQRDWKPRKQVWIVKWAAESRSAVPQSGSGFIQKQESDDKFASTQAQKVLTTAGASCSTLHKNQRNVGC